ncbi:MAG TPA: hypothetical protein VF283_12845, partial [Bryobacteraceae bacterium]
QNCQAILQQLIDELFPKESAEPNCTAFATALRLSDEELMERAKSARNGDRFRRLWEGDISDYDNDHSRADLALCGILAFWCRGDIARIDRLFRSSGLMRDKWDRRTGDSAYGVRTIRAALQGD